MLDLKAKLLAAGVVTADQVKKVEEETAAKQARDAERREADRRRREEGGPRGDRGDRGGDRGPRADRGDRGGPRPDRGPRGPRPGGGDRPDGGPRGDRRDRGPRGGERRPNGVAADGVAADGAVVEGGAEGAAGAAPQQGRPPRPRDTRSFKERRADENLEKRAKREHEWAEAARWRTRLDALQAAGKTEQFSATRGWVMTSRLDNKVISEAAERFFFTTWFGTLSHLTVEPDVAAQLKDGSAGIVAFMGYNGLEHAVVPADVVKDIRLIKPEWLRHLIGVTDLEPPMVRPTPEPGADADAADGDVVAADGEVVAADGEAAAADGEAVAADGDVVAADGEAVAADGEVVAADGEVVAGEGAGAESADAPPVDGT